MDHGLRTSPAALLGRVATIGAVLAAVATASALEPPSAKGAFNPTLQPSDSLVDDGGSLVAKASTGLALTAVGAWVSGGASYALKQTAKVLGETTTPRLGSTWFSAAYWRVAGISALLTVPFLFAAAIQALLRSDLSLLARAAIGYLPVAMLAVSVAAPITMLLLAASDELSAIVSSAAGDAGGGFLSTAGKALGTGALLSGSPFLIFFGALLTVGAAMLLWLELVVREAAVYVIVLMLPLAFAAMVWPARRIWALRAVEVLAALIMSKFVIVATLSLGGAALIHSYLGSFSGMIAGAALLAIAVCAPWALVRLVPMAEIAAGAAASLRGEVHATHARLRTAWEGIGGPATPPAQRDSAGWARDATTDMRRDHDAVDRQRHAVDGDPPALHQAPASIDERSSETDSASAAGERAGDPPTSAEDHPDGGAPAPVPGAPAPIPDEPEPAGSSTRDPMLGPALQAKNATRQINAVLDGSLPWWTPTTEPDGTAEIHDPTPAPQPPFEEAP